ncbi:hypothetical protein RhiirA1_429451, partial [Rhizophagus irregularis]
MSKVIEIEVDDVYKNDAENDDKNNVDENGVDKTFSFDDKRHNGKPITMLEISPNEKYLVTYSEEDRSIVGWNIEDIDKAQLKFHQTVEVEENNELYIHQGYKYTIKNLCKSYGENIYVIDMNNKDKKIAL